MNHVIVLIRLSETPLEKRANPPLARPRGSLVGNCAKSVFLSVSCFPCNETFAAVANNLVTAITCQIFKQSLLFTSTAGRCCCSSFLSFVSSCTSGKPFLFIAQKEGGGVYYVNEMHLYTEEKLTVSNTALFLCDGNVVGSFRSCGRDAVVIHHQAVFLAVLHVVYCHHLQRTHTHHSYSMHYNTFYPLATTSITTYFTINNLTTRVSLTISVSIPSLEQPLSICPTSFNLILQQDSYDLHLTHEPLSPPV